MVNILQAPSPISSKHMHFRCPFLDTHLTIHYLNISVRLGQAIKLESRHLIVLYSSCQ